MQETPVSTSAGEVTEHVVFVHGTFSGETEDVGVRWWQKGSPFSTALDGSLPVGTSCQSLPRQFHWSGDNSQAARTQAATEFFDFVSSLEKPFHVDTPKL